MGDRTCSVSDCDRKFYGRGLCQLHYNRMRNTGTTDARVFTPRVCKVEGCDGSASKPGTARGWCHSHYSRWKRHDDPLGAHVPVVGIAPCAVEDCGELVTARGWCVKHYTRWVRFGDPEARLLGEVIDGCRVCPQCKEDKPLVEWSGAWCKACAAANARRRRLDPAVKAAERESYRRFVEENPGVIAERARAWRKKNPDRVRAQTALRRARLATASVEPVSPQEVFERDGWMCGLCREAIDPALKYPHQMSASLDHVAPLSRGGAHRYTNCQAAHLRCNIRKGARAS